MADAKQDEGKGSVPPYVAFSTTKTFLGTLKEHGVPGRIDRSVLGNFSGQVGSQLMTGLKFLRLIDSDNHPTQQMVDLVAAYGTDEWPRALDKAVRGAYGPLVDSNLSAATPAQFNDRFRALYPAEGDTLRKCMTFFLSAANEAGIPISPYIMKNKKPRTVTVRRKPPKPKPKDTKPKDNGDDFNADDGALEATRAEEERRRQQQRQEAQQTPEQMLVAMLDPAAMDAAEQQAVFTLLLYLKKNQKSGGAP